MKVRVVFMLSITQKENYAYVRLSTRGRVVVSRLSGREFEDALLNFLTFSLLDDVDGILKDQK